MLREPDGPPELDGTGSGHDATACAVRSVPKLIAEKHFGPDLDRMGRLIRALPDTATGTLISRLETSSDPLLLWALHLELDRRGILPCLRWPANTGTQQAEFITLLADLLWFTKHSPGHLCRFKGWRGLFANAPASPKWHATAHRQYLFVASRYSLAHWCATGLGLTDAQRLPLMMLPTRAMIADRRQLQPEPFDSIRVRLLSHSMAHPDRSRSRTPEAIANRRARLWRVFMLAGKDHTATARHWHQLTGESLSRQAVAKQIGLVREVLRDGGV